MKTALRGTFAFSLLLLGSRPHLDGAPLVRFDSASTPADIQDSVALFRGDMGGTNNGVGGGPFTSGFRAINWDDVPESLAAPNALARDFFNATSPRGILFDTAGSGFQVSAANGMTPGHFGNIDASYASTFQPFSPERLFAPLNSTTLDVHFFVPGMANVPAVVSGFGVIFTDVDLPDSASLEFYDINDNELFTAFAPTSGDGGLSFLGVTFTGDEQVFRVRINSGNSPLGAGILDGAGTDLVVMDDFIYAEPVAVPEPSPIVLLGLGALSLSGLVSQLRRKN